MLHVDTAFPRGGMMKSPVVLRLYRHEEAGRLRFVARSGYALDAEADADRLLEEPVGRRVPFRRLARGTTVRSSNRAGDALIELVGDPSAQATARRARTRRRS
jgi:beta-lactamase class A